MRQGRHPCVLLLPFSIAFAVQKSKPVKGIASSADGYQLSFFQLDDPVLSQVRDEIKNLDVNNLTPLEALNKLSEIRRIITGK